MSVSLHVALTIRLWLNEVCPRDSLREGVKEHVRCEVVVVYVLEECLDGAGRGGGGCLTTMLDEGEDNAG